MKSLFVLASVMIVFFLAAPNKIEAQKRKATKIIEGTISDFECGDNCYLTIIDKKGKEHTGLCTAHPLCTKWNAEVMMPDSYKGKRVKVTVGKGKVLTWAGEVMGTMDAFTKIQFTESETISTQKRQAARIKSVKMEFVSVQAGSFLMGSTNGDDDERPVHYVTISHGFEMGKYEVTQAQWRAVMGSNPSHFKECAQCPVDSVSWNDIQGFIRRLNALNDGFIYRLPSEAEWEYACRAGTMTEFAFGNSLSSKQANFDGNDPFGGAAKGVYQRKTVPVGSYQPNGWGLYDMHGNVKEWCEDIWHDSYNGAPSDGSTWMSGGDSSVRVSRGGAWDGGASLLRSASRNGGVADDPLADGVLIGFRLVRLRGRSL